MSIYDIATSRILSMLESGRIPWTKPWMSVNSSPYNIRSGKHYSLLNSMILAKSGAWGTFKQWSDMGCKIRKGERSSVVFFWKMSVSDQENTDTDTPCKESELTSLDRKENPLVRRYKPCLRYYNVFHQSQTDYEENIADNDDDSSVPINDTVPLKTADNIFKEYISRENISFEEVLSNSAWYSPSDDRIHVPSIKQYRSDLAVLYHQVCLHEAAHSTGSASRLNRQGLKDPHFGSEKYGKEELIAELASYYILNTLGIDTEKSIRQNAGYLQSWINALKGDNKLIVFAAPAAEKAARFILGESCVSG